MSTITEEYVKEDIIEDTVIDFEIPCDDPIVEKDCREPAVFIIHMSCCGARYFLCEDCFFEMMAMVKERMEKKICQRCAKCNAHHHNGDPDVIIFDGRVKG